MSKSHSAMPSAQEREVVLFRAAAELSPGPARQAFLDQACDNPALRRRLETLLAAHEQPDTSLDQAASVLNPTLKLELPNVEEEVVGQTIGHYKLLEKVG